MAKNRAHYDIIVNGSNLTAILLAYHYGKQGKKVLVLDESDDLGGAHFSVQPDADLFRSSLELLPDSEAITEQFAWLNTLLDETVLGESFEQSVKTYKDAQFKSFVGFKDLKFESADDTLWFSQSKVRHLMSRPHEWVQKIIDSEVFEVSLLSKITEYTFDEGSLQSVKVNQTKTLSADHYIHCESPWGLDHMMSDSKAITNKERSAFAKMEGWTWLSLQLVHPKMITEDRSCFILHGSKTDFEPTVGRFFDVGVEGEEVSQNSTWNCLIHADYSEDMEHVGATLRNMKKQIKRGFANAFDEGTLERIQVLPSSVSNSQSEAYEAVTLNKIDNLLIASPLNSPQKDIGAFIEAAYRISVQLKFDTETTTETVDLATSPEATIAPEESASL